MNVSTHGEQLAHLPRVDVSYNLHDLLPGSRSRHLYGLRAITIYNPRITVVHNPDGTYNLPKVPKSGPSKPGATPMNFTMNVVDGSLAVIDNTRLDPAARHLSIRNVNFAAAINSAARSHYVASMAYDDGSARYPINGRGTIDNAMGLNYQRWTAVHIPLPQLINYALNNAQIRMRAGYLDNLDARYYGKIAASAYLRGGRVTMQGVSEPIENVHGPLDVTSAGLTTPHIDATIAGAPIRLAGAIYDLAHPTFRMVVRANGNVARLKKLTTAAARLPLSGHIDLALLVEGAVRTPLALILMHSPEIDYRTMPLKNPNGMLAFDGKTASILNFGMQYGRFTLGARGRMALVKEPNAIEAVANVKGPSDELPYAPAIIPSTALDGTILATANDLKHLDTHGVLDGTGPSGNLASTFAIASNGVGSVRLHAPSLDAKIAIDHPHDTMNALVRARSLALRPAAAASLPGLNVKPLPPLTGTVNGDVFASRQGNALGLLGNVAIAGVRYGKISISRAVARFGGSAGNVRVATLAASGNFGSVNARGSITGTDHVALEGLYSGSLAQVSSIAGNLPAHGVVNAPIALVYDGGRAVAQIRDARFVNAAVRGIPIEGMSATIGMRQSNIDVYAAHAQVARSGDAVATGNIGGSSGQLAFSLSQFPIEGGYANAAATAHGSLRSPDASGTVMLTGARYRNYPIGGASTIAYNGGVASVRDAMIDAGPALVAADGTVWPRYDLNASASGLVSFAPFQGSVDANVHVAGTGTSPDVTGTLDAPEGNLNGLAFRSLHANIAGTPSDMHVNNGSVQVGSTTLAFNAAVAPGSMQATVNAPRADLADFNDYFDTGDTLGGRGRLALSVAMTPFTLASTGNVNLQGVRFRRFDIGRTVADWNTSGRSTSVVASVDSAHGTAHIAGTVEPKARMMNLNANVRNLDLGSWLPLLGYTTPVTGFIDANAALRGRYPDIAMNANANLRDGVVGKIHVLRAQIAATANNGRGRITQAVVQIPYFVAEGSGTFGLHRSDPLDVTAHGNSTDVGKLVETVSGKPNEIAGVLDTTLRVNGTASNPLVHDDLTLAQLKYAKLVVPKVQAAINVTRQTVVLTRGVVSLHKGTVTASGEAPLQIPKGTVDPIALTIAANAVDLSDFTAALPEGSKVAGLLNGTMHVAGSLKAPTLGGGFALQKGYYVGPMDQNPISNLDGQIAFNGTEVALNNVHANVGGGTFAMNATASAPSLKDMRAATFNSNIVANNAQVNNPTYFRGKFNADIHAYRTAGGLPTIAGTVDVPSARVPLTAFWNPHAPKTQKQSPLNLAFNMTANAGHDVRVQSPNVDVGVQGDVNVSGTLKQPALKGRVASTGGTVNFLRQFSIRRAVASFSPSEGFWPYVDAIADTQVSNPLTYIELQVTGLAPNSMQLNLQSDPTYDRTQILGLLAGLQSLGAVNGVAATNATGGFTVGGAVQNMALGQLNSFFTRSILEPLNVGLGQALGLQNLQLSDDFTSGFGVSAAKAFGKHITAQFAQNLGSPKQSSLSIQAHHGESTAFDLMFYSVQDPPLTGFLTQNNNPFNFNSLGNNSTLMGLSGTNGVSLTFQHRFH